MQLVEFSYEKFRSIKDKISIPIHKISVFIGENGGGKTTTLDALDLFFDLEKIIEEKDLNNNFKISKDLEIFFIGQFTLNEKDQEFFQKFDPDIKNQIILSKKFNLIEKMTKYFINCKGTGTKLDNLELGGRKKPYEDLCDEYKISHKGKNIEKMKESLRKKCNELPKDKYIQKIITKSDLEPFLPKYILFSSETAFDPKVKIIEILRETLKKKIPDLDISNEVNKITKVILKICNEKIKEASDLIGKYCNDISSINAIPTYDPLKGLNLNDFDIIKKEGDKIKFESEATGKRKQIMLGIYEWSELQITEEIEKNFILAFDEPDLHFDYVQISNLLRILREFSNKKNIQVITVTHSIKLIDNFPPNNIVHFKLIKNLISEVDYLTKDQYEQIGDFLKQISLSIGFRSAFLFFEKVFVMVEGDTEYRALPILFEIINKRTSIEAGLSFINAENNDNAIIFAKY